MTKVSKDEVIAIARVSHIAIEPEELEPMTHQLQEVLTYAARVKEISGTSESVVKKNYNIYRSDIIVASDAEIIKSQTPERQGDYFVVPIILDSSGQ